MTNAGVEVRELETPSEHAALGELLAQIWPTPGGATPYASDLFTALAHTGSYVVAAYADTTMIGGGFGFLARHHGELVLHSHAVGVVESMRHRAVGAAIKHHQFDWARREGLGAITWTFDPLVRRNAYFNLTKLGARVVGYLPNFYGPLTDAFNAGDETDRALVEWRVGGDPAPLSGGAERVFIPDDIVALRASDPVAARGWRERVREEFGTRIQDGAVATSLSRDGWYTLEMP